jgi:radical SAM-linked protein
MRIRIKFSKTGPLRYIGNLDLHTIWERAARRADLPLAYSHGFHPQPKIHLASPLPLGFSSRHEVVDLRLDEDVPLSDLAERLQAALPHGIGILSIDSVDPMAPPLPALLIATDYEITLPAASDPRALLPRIDTLMAQTSILRQRRGKAYDLRPLIEDLHLEMDNSGGPPQLHVRLSAREGATGRPDEVLETLGIPVEETKIERTNLLFQK